MSSKEKSLEKEENQKDSSSEEHIEPNYKEKAYKMLLDIEEKPEIIIEKILISIFNKYITPSHVDIDFLDLQMHHNKIRLLCIQQEKSKIVYILLTKIRSLIKKYREKLFELPNIIELREKIFQKNYKRSYSLNRIISKKYLNFFQEKRDLNTSYPKIKKFNYYRVIKNLFCELKNIRNCLRKTAPIIEKIFEIPLSKYAKFSIWECEKEDYLKILIHDNFIWNQIRRTNNFYLHEIINEITEDDDKNLSTMTDAINYFKLIEEYKKINLDDILKISEIGSSIDTRFPEDAEPKSKLKEELYESIITNDKDMRYPFLDVDIDEYTNSEEPNNEDINKISKVTIYKALKKGGLNKSILSNNINININNESKLFNIPNLLKNNDINNDKITSLNKNIEIKSINKMNKKKKKETKKKEIIKKENNKSNKKVKIDKNEIPNDIDDLVKYIVNDDKTETQNKKKKRNKKRKKKNKNEIKKNKKESFEEEIKEKEKKDDTEEVKKDFIVNSINRFKIHKIKFKYRPKWLNKIKKNS